MAQFKKNVGHMRKSSLLKALGVPVPPVSTGNFNNDFDESFQHASQDCISRFSNEFSDNFKKSTFGKTLNPTQRLFYNLCDTDWDIVGYDPTVQVVEVIFYRKNVVISLNIPRRNTNL
jgi:hypothetical protein